MPREFLPQQRKRESRGEANQFPRTEARVMVGPACDRMIRKPTVVDRHLVKQELREMAAAGAQYPSSSE